MTWSEKELIQPLSTSSGKTADMSAFGTLLFQILAYRREVVAVPT